MSVILYEHEHYVVISKPNGITVTHDKTEGITIKEWMKEQYDYDIFEPIHRIDRPVSGCLMLAKTEKGFVEMTDLFRSRNIRKVYHCLVKNKPKNERDHLHHFLKRIERINISKPYLIPVEGAKDAILDYEFLKSIDDVHLIEVMLKTGRHHQIRVQMSFIGSPIIGDSKYGSTIRFPTHAVMLHSKSLEFVCPFDKVIVKVNSDYPSVGLWNLFSSKNKEAVEIMETSVDENVVDY